MYSFKAVMRQRPLIESRPWKIDRPRGIPRTNMIFRRKATSKDCFVRPSVKKCVVSVCRKAVFNESLDNYDFFILKKRAKPMTKKKE